MASHVLRSMKNVTKGYSHVQVKIRDATSNDPWGPTGAQMAEIASMTFNGPQDFVEIVDMLEKRLNDKGKNWRHVLKSLKVVEYCLHEGSDLCVTWARKNIYLIKTLESFVYDSDDGRDVGAAIRASAKSITGLIRNEEQLKSERAGGKWQSRVQTDGFTDGYPNGGSSMDSPNRQRRERPQRRRSEDDTEYKLALEASKAEAEAEARRRANGNGQEDDDLAQAIKLSKEEDELRKRELERQNAEALFDDAPATTQPTGFNQGYQQQAAVDWYGNPMEQQQQPQTTGYLNNMYQAQPSFQQPQQTGYMPQYMPAQPTGYNPWANQMNGVQQQQVQPQPVQAQQPQPTGSNNPWASSTQQPSIAPMPTGSNNPFATKMNNATTSNVQRAPTLSTLQEQRTAQQPSYNPIMNYQAPQQQPQQQQQQQQQQPVATAQPARQPQDPHHAQLNALLASGAGLDTYGNTGDLRLPAQHTAPGTFVNSSGQGLNQLEVHRTGNNPFLHNQFTGMAPTQYPSATGPVRGMQSSPFGVQGQQQQGAQTGSLIDL